MLAEEAAAALAPDGRHCIPHYYAVIKYYVRESVLSRYLCSDEEASI
jgi:hypothetical protein